MDLPDNLPDATFVGSVSENTFVDVPYDLGYPLTAPKGNRQHEHRQTHIMHILRQTHRVVKTVAPLKRENRRLLIAMLKQKVDAAQLGRKNHC